MERLDDGMRPGVPAGNPLPLGNPPPVGNPPPPAGPLPSGAPPPLELQDKHWKVLRERIASGTCTPIIGAGACLPLLPTGGELARELARQYQYPFLDSSSDLARVTQFIAVTSGDQNAPKIAIRDILNERLARAQPALTPSVHDVLARLESKIYLTTNYDDLMHAALRRRTGIEPHVETCRWNNELLKEESAFDTGFQPDKQRPVVFHLHGALTSLDSIVATEDDYLDFLVNLSKDLASSPVTLENRRRAMLPLAIRGALAQHTLLFIGYSLADINFRLILRTLVASLERSRRHLSITLQLPLRESEHKDVAAVRQYLEQYYKMTFDLQVYWGTADDFSATLARRLDQRQGEP